MTVVLATYAKLLNNVVDQVFNWAEKGPRAGVSDLKQLLGSLTRRQLGVLWEEVFVEFQRQGKEYRRQQEFRWGSGFTVAGTGGHNGAGSGAGPLPVGRYSSRPVASAPSAPPGYPDAVQDRDRVRRDGWQEQDQGGTGPGGGSRYGFGQAGPGVGQGYQYTASNSGYRYGVGDRRPPERGAEGEPGAQRQRQ